MDLREIGLQPVRAALDRADIVVDAIELPAYGMQVIDEEISTSAITSFFRTC
jgi:hypothetical protein